MTRNYELVVILSDRLDEKQKEKITAKIQEKISLLKGKLEKAVSWGLKTLAYPIKKREKGFYIEFNFLLSSQKISELEKTLKLEEDILRYLIINKGNKGA